MGVVVNANLRTAHLMKIPNPLSGTSPLVFWLNRLRDCVLSRTIQSGRGYKAISSPQGTVLDIDFQSGGRAQESQVAMYKLKSIQGDYLTCLTWDGGTAGTEDVYIAKNYKLRNSISSATINGELITYSYGQDHVTRTAVDTNGHEETQTVIPYYLVGDIIIAANVAPSMLAADLSQILWQDLNVDARAWTSSSC